MKKRQIVLLEIEYDPKVCSEPALWGDPGDHECRLIWWNDRLPWPELDVRVTKVGGLDPQEVKER